MRTAGGCTGVQQHAVDPVVLQVDGQRLCYCAAAAKLCQAFILQPLCVPSVLHDMRMLLRALLCDPDPNAEALVGACKGAHATKG